MTSSAFVDTTRALAAVHGVDVDVVVDDSHARGSGGARTLVRSRRRTIHVSGALTQEPAEVQAFMAAHEIAHVALRHRYWTRAWPGALWALVVSALQVAGLLALLDQPSAASNGRVAAAVVAGGFVGPLVAGVGAQLLLAQRTRAVETAADRQAFAWGYRLEESAAETLVAGETWVSTSRWYRPFRMHPLPADRLRTAHRWKGTPS